MALVGLGGSLFWIIESTTWDEVDTELTGVAQAITSTIHPPRRSSGGRRPPPPTPIPRTYRRRIDNGELYYLIWDRDQNIVEKVNTEQKFVYPKDRESIQTDTPFKIQKEIEREIIIRGPRARLILVGRNIEKEKKALDQLKFNIISIGVGILTLGLLGGWWISRRVTRPIDSMSQTAEEISGFQFDQRIETKTAGPELARLGKVLNAAFDRLEQALHQQTQFTADASHELRTPLSVILTQVESSLKRVRTEEEYQQTLEACQRAALRMNALVNDLLMLARSDVKQLQLQKQEVDLKELILEVLQLLEPLIQEKNAKIDFDSDSLRIEIDPKRFLQVLTNLVQNALIHNPEGLSIKIYLTQLESSAKITVSDDGVGIPDEERSKIFDRFQRVDQARNRKTGGSGLGLAITKSIVEAHGGEIACLPHAPKGTTFEVSVPSIKNNTE